MTSKNARDVVIVSALRTAVGKAPRGALSQTRPDELGAAVVRAVLQQAGSFAASDLEDLILGCAFPEGAQGMNVARVIGERAGIPRSVPAMTINRFCSSGIQSMAIAADRIAAGNAEAIIAGGCESMSYVPLGGHGYQPNPYLVKEAPENYLNMGLTAERVAEQWSISREQQDLFALSSHQRALAAQKEGRFDDEIVPIEVTRITAHGAETRSQSQSFARDEGPRPDTSAERLAKLRPAFHARGTVTAGNTSQTSDGAGAALLLSREKAEACGLPILAKFCGFQVAGVDPDIMGIGPIAAVPKLLERAELSLADIDLFELNEAFAAQALAVMKELGIDAAKVNVNGGAIALGHPLGATGAKLTATLLHEMQKRSVRYGIVTMCIGGGMGAAALFERE